MTVNKNKVAILLATYNGEKYIRKQLDSLAKQSYSEFTCFIHDDGSSDNTKKVVDDFISRDDRFVYVDGPSQHGAKGNFMYLLSNIESEYYLFCDQDDYWHTDKVKRLLSLLVKIENEKPSLCFCNLNVVNDEGKVISEDFMEYSGFYVKKLDYKNILFKNVAPGCVMILNKRLRNEAIKLKSLENIAMHDWWCIAVACTKGNCSFLNESLNDYYQHSTQQIGAVRDDNSIKKVKNKLLCLFSNKEKAEKQKWLEGVSNQAKEVCDLLLPDDPNYQELYNLAHLREHCKVTRMSYLLHYHWNYAGSLFWDLWWI